MLLLTNDEVASVLNMPECVRILEDAYADFGLQDAVDIPRQDMVVQTATEGAVHIFKTLSGSWPRQKIAALRFNSDIVSWPLIGGLPRKVKLPLSKPQGRYNGLVELFSTETGQLLCIFPDGVMQKTRVGGASAVAAKFLSRPDSRILGLLGTGWQAEAHLEAMCAVRQFDEAKVYSPNPENRRRFVERCGQRVGVKIRAVGSAEEAAQGADVLVSATNSMTPTLDPAWIKPGMHLASVRASEIPLAVLERVDTLVVNSREPVTAFPTRGWPSEVPDFTNGDYGRPDIGVFDMSQVPELKDIACGRIPGRRSVDEITCFHNFKGLGLQFAALGVLVYQGARDRKLGRELDDEAFTQTEHP